MNTDLYPKIYLYRRIVQSKLYIDKHFAEATDLVNISGEAYFSKFHFLRIFKKIYGKTPHQYLTFVRIEEARKLLRAGTPIAEVTHRVGYDSISSFCGLFKKMTGITPSAYQLQQAELTSAMVKVPLRFVPHCFAKRNGWSQKSNFQEVNL